MKNETGSSRSKAKGEVAGSYWSLWLERGGWSIGRSVCKY